MSIDSVCIDWLHTVSLGIFRHVLGCFVWLLIDENVWGVGGSADARKELSMAQCRAMLFDWYAAEDRAERPHTRVQALTLGMLSHRNRPELTLHGAEANGFLRFAAGHLFPRFADKLPQAKL